MHHDRPTAHNRHVSDLPSERPVRLVVTDDLSRSRWTVAFRLVLAIPVLIVYVVWSLASIVAVVIAWFVLLVRGRLGDGLHGFLVGYVRFTVRMNAYLHLVANPWPGLGTVLHYPVNAEIAPPAPQRRWTVLLRIFLAIPALLLAAVTGGGGGSVSWRRGSWSASSAGGTGGTVAVLGWFASLATGRMPRGLRDLGAYGIGYSAQALAYALLLTDVYPSAHPRLAGPMALPDHPVRLVSTDDLARPRLIVFFRLLLALPHLVWFALWSLTVIPASVLGWLAALMRARLPHPLHRFLTAYVRYSLHLGAFIYGIGGPFPGFVGAAGSYPVDVTTPSPERQGRWTIGFRVLLAVPALLVASAYGSVAFVVAVLGWCASLIRGRMPDGLQAVGAAALRYQAQTLAYALLVTGRYPYAAPALEDELPPAIEPPSADAPVPA
jgi:hypothetical protein